MLRVLCSPTPAAFRDNRAFNWRMLHVDVLGQNNDRERNLFGRVALLYRGRAGAANPCFATACITPPAVSNGYQDYQANCALRAVASPHRVRPKKIVWKNAKSMPPPC